MEEDIQLIVMYTTLFYVWACLYNWGLRNVWGPILENQLEWMSGEFTLLFV